MRPAYIASMLAAATVVGSFACARRSRQGATSDPGTPPVAEKATVDSGAPYYVYVLMTDKGEPKLDYEGPGFIRNSGSTRDSSDSQRFKCELIAMVLPEGAHYALGGRNDVPENYVLQLTATLAQHGQDGIRVSGTVKSRLAGRLQFVKMVHKPDASGSASPETAFKPGEDGIEFPEMAFEPGESRFDFRGRIVGWIEIE